MPTNEEGNNGCWKFVKDNDKLCILLILTLAHKIEKKYTLEENRSWFSKALGGSIVSSTNDRFCKMSPSRQAIKLLRLAGVFRIFFDLSILFFGVR